MEKSPVTSLREIFANNLDLEHELYDQYESLLNSYGLKFNFYFSPKQHIDFKTFLNQYSLWQFFEASVLTPSLSFSDLRQNLYSPWILGGDFCNVMIKVGSQVINIENRQQGVTNLLNLKDLLRLIYLGEDRPRFPAFQEAFKDFNFELALKELAEKRFVSIKLIRTDKDSSGFRAFMEQKNSFKSSYMLKLEERFQAKIKELLFEDSLPEAMLRLRIQDRLKFWGKNVGDEPLSPDALRQIFENLSLQGAFRSVLDASYFLDSLTVNTNESLQENIDKNPYKAHLLKFIATLERQEALVLSYQGETLEGLPLFKLRLR